MLNKLFTEILNFVIPPLCVSCNNPLDRSDLYLCCDCSVKLVPFESQHPWKEEYISKGFIDNSFSLYKFVKDTPIQHLLHSLKYEKMKSIGLILGKEIGQKIPLNVDFDYTIPVPLHTAKFRERTYNQSEYLCRGINESTNTEMIPKLLLRNRFTKSQTNLNRNERQDNVKGAFEINNKYKELISKKNIILIDDVITTGATILECAKVLKENGANYIMICSAAYDAINLN